MGRKKKADSLLLKVEIKTRINEATHEKLLKLMRSSRHRSLGSLLREIVCNRPIATYVVDESLSMVMEELTSIQKEINRIGVNINQVTRQIHGAGNPIPRTGHVLALLAFQKALDEKIAILQPIISQLSKKWLR